jgi:hypothetical protein
MLAGLLGLFLAAQATAPVPAPMPEESSPDLSRLLQIRRVYVDRLGGGETAAQIRDMIIHGLHSARLFVVTENPDRADAILRGSAEDLVFTDQFTSSEGINARASIGAGSTSKQDDSLLRRSAGVTVGERESTHISERKHEASASVRLVAADGDVIWSTTQESMGGKFRGASADVAEKITRQLVSDHQKAKKISTAR